MGDSDGSQKWGGVSVCFARAGVCEVTTRRFRDGLSDSVIRQFRAGDALPPSQRRFLNRSLAWVYMSGGRPVDVTDRVAAWLVEAATIFAPQALRGSVLGTTFAGRHRAANAKLASLVAEVAVGPVRVLEVGCGVPPFGCMEAAQQLPSAEFSCIELDWPAFLALPLRGGAMALNRQLRPTRVQPSPYARSLDDGIEDLRVDVERLVSALGPVSVLDSSGAWAAETDAGILIKEPRRYYSNGNVECLDGPLSHVPSEQYQVVRMMNVLQYYRRDDRERMKQMAQQVLCRGGYLVTGTSFMESLETRLRIEQKTERGLQLRETSFGLDNVTPLGVNVWMDLYGDGFEIRELARTLRELHSNREFDGEWFRAFDNALEEVGFGRRSSDGYLVEAEPEAPVATVYSRLHRLYEGLVAAGFASRASDALRDAGVDCHVDLDGAGLTLASS
jgi:hypothetical protein